MRAVRLAAINQIEIADVPAPVAAVGEAVVSIRAAALNHRDVWIKAGQYAGLKFPCIPGSDCAGVVEAVGAGADPSWLGREVIVNPSFGWGADEAAQGPEFSILGLPREGTLAEKVAVPVSQLAAKPAHLTWEEAAALPLAGLTAWRAVIARAQLLPGQRMLVTGVGGGVALFALQLGVVHGADVWVTSGSEGKIARAVELGAKGGAIYTEENWGAELVKRAGGLFDVIVDSAGGPGFEALLDVAAPGGRVVFYGATRGNPPVLPMRKVFWRQLSLLGTTMGSPADWQSLVQFVGQRKLSPVIGDVMPLERAADAFALMARGDQFGKIVVKMA